MSAIADAVRWAEEILREIDRGRPVKCQKSLAAKKKDS